MLRNLLSITNKFYEDQATIFLTFVGVGRYVLYLLYEEFRRLRLPENKVRFLAFDTEQPHRDRVDLHLESEYMMHLEHFDGDVYIANDENKVLKKAVNHIPVNLLCDIEAGCKGVPAVGFDDGLDPAQHASAVDAAKHERQQFSTQAGEPARGAQAHRGGSLVLWRRLASQCCCRARRRLHLGEQCNCLRRTAGRQATGDSPRLHIHKPTANMSCICYLRPKLCFNTPRLGRLCPRSRA